MSLTGSIVYALRQFRQAPVFTATAIATLALGIGGTTAIFSLMHDIMLRSLPVQDPAALYRIGASNTCCMQGGPQDDWGMYPYPLFQKLKAAAPEFESMTAFQSTPWRYSVMRPNLDKVPKPMRGLYVSGNYFSTFGIKPFAGRLLTEQDDQPASAPVIVMSYRTWAMEWGADTAILGTPVVIQGQSFHVAGIAPPGFFGETLRSNPPDFWIPLNQEPLLSGKDSILRQTVTAYLRVIGRLKPGASIEGVAPRLTGLMRNYLESEAGFPPAWMGEIRKSLPKQNIRIIPAGNGVEEMRESYGRSLQILLAVCGLVLLIACANVANLLMARAMARRTETSIRLAMGATRGHLLSQGLVESVLLAIGGGLAGMVVAFGAEKLLANIAFPRATYLPFELTPSWPVLAFAFGLSLLTGVIFGLGPSWLATRRDPVEALRGANRSTHDHSSIARRVLLVLQAAFSVVLVAGAALMTRSLGNLEKQDLGFRNDGLMLVSVNSPPSSYTFERLDVLYRDLQRKLESIPGVERASLAMYAPLTDNWSELVFVDGHPPAELNEKSSSSWNRVSPGHFETVGQPLLRGRAFTEADTKTTENVAVVNEAFVRRFFPDKSEDPLDRRFGMDMPEYARSFRIVGIVRDAKYTQPRREARPMFFVPLAQTVKYAPEIMQKLESRSHFINSVMLRAPSRKPGELEPILRKVLAEADPIMTVINVRAMQDQVAIQFDQQRAVASLAGVFGLIALVLAAVGLYGVTAYSVAQRTGEIGVRVALGANSARVLRLVLTSAFRTAGVGLLLGLPLAIGAGKLISTQLYGVEAWDPAALSVAIGALGLAAFVAAIIPALRAAAIDPMRALRME